MQKNYDNDKKEPFWHKGSLYAIIHSYTVLGVTHYKSNTLQ